MNEDPKTERLTDEDLDVLLQRDDDDLKLLSFLKVLAKGKRVSPRVLERLREQVDAQGK